MPLARNALPEAASSVYQLKITLIGSQPPIWRRVLIVGDTKLDKLHEIFQKAMGWRDCHLHMFEAGKARYAPSTPDWDDVEDESAATFQDIAAKAGISFSYVYDIGDGWRHEVEVETILPRMPDFKGLCCVAGARACPPEDCGGIGGYEELLKAIRDPGHERHKELLDWLGGAIDPEKFDIAAVNRRMLRISHGKTVAARPNKRWTR